MFSLPWTESLYNPVNKTVKVANSIRKSGTKHVFLLNTEITKRQGRKGMWKKSKNDEIKKKKKNDTENDLKYHSKEFRSFN